VITGFSGAGKSTAMAAFEDEGFFCVDNLPPEMISSLVELFMHSGAKVARAAVVSDGSRRQLLRRARVPARRTALHRVRLRILFLEADEGTLLTRYKRPGAGTAGADRERGRGDRARAGDPAAPARAGGCGGRHQLLTAAMLRRKLTENCLPPRPGAPGVTSRASVSSTGPAATPISVRRPLPAQSAYELQLRQLTGADRRWCSSSTVTARWTRSMTTSTRAGLLLPQLLAEGKAHLVVAMLHRGTPSLVAIARHLADRYADRAGYSSTCSIATSPSRRDRARRVRGLRPRAVRALLRRGFFALGPGG